MLRRLKLIMLFCVLIASCAVKAQNLYLPPLSPADTTISVSLLTCAPGSDVYELEGHSGLRIEYGNGNDIVVHWGLFDFNTPGFVYRFVKGETDYSIGAMPANIFLWMYASTGRRVTQQRLNLTAEQCRRVIELIDINLRPENRIYRYNYVKDNCATRPLAIIETAIGTPVSFGISPAELGGSPTFRSEMRHFHRNYPWYQFGIDLALGSGIDSEISTRETIFAPVILQQLVASATITVNGKTEPLVSDTEIIVDGPAEGIIQPATPWILTPMAAMLLLLIVACILTFVDCRRKHVSRCFDALLFTAFGIIGTIIAFLILISTHEATSPNYLILWLNPVCFIVPALIFTRFAKKVLSKYFFINIALSLIYILLIALQMQSINMAFIPMILTGILRSYNYIRTNRETSKNK